MATRDHFLSNVSVKEFIAWLVQKSDGGFTHMYCVIPKGKATVTEKWRCNSIYNAYENYCWVFSYEDRCNRNVKVTGFTFKESEDSIAVMKNNLLEGFDRNDEQLVFDASCMMLDWGGVLKRGRKGKTNKDKLINIKDSVGLIEYFSNVKRLLNINSTATQDKYSFIGSDCNSYSVVMNSGFTKIYSILLEDFIIYDGRVGAALGLLVSKWAEESTMQNGADSLMFAYGNSAKSSKCLNNKKRRNPSSETLRFPNLFQGEKKRKSIQHIHNNIKASWLVKEVLMRSPENSLFNQIKNPMRAYEAALFMIGGCTYYDCDRNNV